MYFNKEELWKERERHGKYLPLEKRLKKIKEIKLNKLKEIGRRQDLVDS